MTIIRFAAIPKSGSRTLKVYGLLGELNDHPHMCIRDYPDWEQYEWHMVVRDAAMWLESFWYEAAKVKGPVCTALGLEFKDMRDDINRLNDPGLIDIPSDREHLFHWLPHNFKEVFEPYRGRFYDFCRDTITDGVPCNPVELGQLDTWLTAHGLNPLHLNRRALNGIA